MGIRSVLAAENMTLATGLCLAAFRPAASGSAAALIKVTRVEISQSGTTTLEMVRGDLATRDTAGTFTLTATTPRVTSPIDGPASGLTGNTAPAGGAARSGTDSSADSGGTYTSIFPFAFANLNGYIWKPDPQEEILVVPDQVFIVRFLANPADLDGWNCAVFLDEL